MKKILVGALAFGAAFTGSAAFAGQSEDLVARLDALEKENAAIRRENAALSENKALREKNATLKSSAAPSRRVVQPVARVAVAPAAEPERAAGAAPAKSSDKVTDFFGAYAADLPVAYKARVETPGQFRVWGEGGAIWSGGDRIIQDFNLGNFTSGELLLGLGLGTPGGGPGGSFDLTPKIGWEAATGFDYRFANSLYHVSGQFRYGRGGKTSGSAATSGTVDPAIIDLFNSGDDEDSIFSHIASAGGNERFGASYRETHWLADLAVGRDVLGSGPDAMQVKGGIRVSEFVSKLTTVDATNTFVNFTQPIQLFGDSGPLVSALSTTRQTLTSSRNSFLGAGPRIGIEGTVPFAGKWGFEYLGDTALLFGTQKSLNSTTKSVLLSPAFLNGFNTSTSNNQNTFLAERFATVFNTDIQLGLSYWILPNVKMTGSYRLDAWINVQNQSSSSVRNLTPDRYVHGPRLAVMGQF